MSGTVHSADVDLYSGTFKLEHKKASVIKLERVSTSSEGNGRPWEAWKVLKQFGEQGC